MAKAAHWPGTDAHVRKRGGANRIRYPEVHAVNDGRQPSDSMLFGGAANALSIPPGEYGSKTLTKGIDGGRSGQHVV